MLNNIKTSSSSVGVNPCHFVQMGFVCCLVLSGLTLRGLSQVWSESFINNDTLEVFYFADKKIKSLHSPTVICRKRTLTTQSISVNIVCSITTKLSGSDWFSRRMWDSQVWQLLKIKWQLLMRFQTSASHCILPSPDLWHTSKPWFYRTGHGGVNLFSQLSAIRRPECSQPFSGVAFPISRRSLYVPYRHIR